MGLFNWFGEHEHTVFTYKPVYYDERKDKLGLKEDDKPEYVPGSYIKESQAMEEYRHKTHSNKAQNIIGIIGLILVVVVLMYIAKFFTL